jgi:hypothetical protein
MIAAMLIAVTASSAYASSEDVIPVERFQPTITQEIAHLLIKIHTYFFL